MREPRVFLDDQLVPLSAAAVSVRDRSFRYGEGVFETLRSRGARAFRAGEHLERLRGSAASLGWRLPWTAEALRQALDRTLEANDLAEGRARIHASAGTGGPDGEDGRPLLVVDVEPFRGVDDGLRARGVALRTSPYRRSRRDPAAGAKTASYLASLLARRTARRAGAHDAVLLDDDGNVCEASCANLFAVRGGSVLTPPVGPTVLAGVTRAVVLDLAASAGEAVRVERLTLEDLLSADEVFLTSTVVEILPAVNVDGRRIGPGEPGPVARTLLATYRAALDHELGIQCAR